MCTCFICKFKLVLYILYILFVNKNQKKYSQTLRHRDFNNQWTNFTKKVYTFFVINSCIAKIAGDAKQNASQKKPNNLKLKSDFESVVYLERLNVLVFVSIFRCTDSISSDMWLGWIVFCSFKYNYSACDEKQRIEVWISKQQKESIARNYNKTSLKISKTIARYEGAYDSSGRMIQPFYSADSKLFGALCLTVSKRTVSNVYAYEEGNYLSSGWVVCYQFMLGVYIYIYGYGDDQSMPADGERSMTDLWICTAVEGSKNFSQSMMGIIYTLAQFMTPLKYQYIQYRKMEVFANEVLVDFNIEQWKFL